MPPFHDCRSLTSILCNCQSLTDILCRELVTNRRHVQPLVTDQHSLQPSVNDRHSLSQTGHEPTLPASRRTSAASVCRYALGMRIIV